MADTDILTTLLLPLSGHSLLVPSANIAEIISASESKQSVSTIKRPDSSAEQSEWMVGHVNWREVLVPLISIEALCGQPLPAITSETRIVILYSLAPKEKNSPYLGVLVQGVPRLLHLTRNTVTNARDESPLCPAIAARVRAEGLLALIPNLDALTAQVSARLSAPPQPRTAA